MKLEMLDKEQIEVVYNERMKEDFPPDELKPLAMIYKAIDNNMYECFGLMENGNIVGYTFLIKIGDDYLIDYLATYPDRRNAGLGGTIIRLLGEYLVNAKSIIGEVEDPDMAECEEDRVLQTRRYNFYMRNGFRDTGVKATTFGVPFRLIEMGEGLVHDEEQMKNLYLKHYKAILPPELHKNVTLGDF